jgi:replicative DNA helicase
MKLLKINKTKEYKEIDLKEIKDDWKNRKILGVNGWSVIKQFSYIKTGKTIMITTKNGTLKCDPNHKVLTNNGEKFVKDLDDNDKLIGYKNEELLYSKKDSEVNDLYDIEIDDPHLYYTSGIVSHNSTLIINTIVSNCMNGKKVLHVSLENDEKVTGHRYLGAFTEMAIKSRESNQEVMKNKLKKIKTMSNSDLYIVYFPTDSVNIDAVELAVRELELHHGFKPDIIALDYLECLLVKDAHKNKDEHTRQKGVSAEFRSLCGRLNVFGVTASQTNRGAESIERTGKENGSTGPIDLTKLADSYSKAFPFDYIISINQNKSEYESKEEESHIGKFRLYIAKNRNGKKGITVNSTVNYATMKVREDSV